MALVKMPEGRGGLQREGGEGGEGGEGAEDAKGAKGEAEGPIPGFEGHRCP